MADHLRIEMSPPVDGGMMLRISSGPQEFAADFTTQVCPFFEAFCDAIRVLHDGFIDDRIRLLIGAPECDLLLQAAAHSSQAVLKINLWPDHKRSTLVPEPTVFRFEGARQEIISPFVAALTSVRAGLSDAEFAQAYRAPFPTAAYAALMRRVQMTASDSIRT
ncbi:MULTISPECIES: hypothetical protein [unclassified Bradyrhizobium]|uniref:hypothetical protein n=1 Tax=unclassified Bradyrhizobium TaxID=2631580 RepID=UPI0028EB54B6|nr:MULTISPECIES: hypothetical protein [unclassified Bradyrhizobium]